METFSKSNGFFCSTFFLVFFLIAFLINFYTYALASIRVFFKRHEEIKSGTRKVFMVPLILFLLIICFHFFLIHRIWGGYAFLLVPVLIIVLYVMHILTLGGLLGDETLSFINAFFILIGDLYFIHLFILLCVNLFFLNFAL